MNNRSVDKMEIIEKEKVFYPNTKIERPAELTGGGRGDYCCVPGCKNAS